MNKGTDRLFRLAGWRAAVGAVLPVSIVAGGFPGASMLE